MTGFYNGTYWTLVESTEKETREEIYYDDLDRTQGSNLYFIEKDNSGSLIDAT